MHAPHTLRVTVAALSLAFSSATLVATPGDASDPTSLKEEHVTGGVLDLSWENGFGVSNNLVPLTLAPDHPAYVNPSGDHTVGVATNSMAPDSGGVVLTCTDTQGATDYSWEGWIFTGDGNTRRGLVVRADPTVQNFNGLPAR